MKLGRILVFAVTVLLVLFSPPISLINATGDLSIILGTTFLAFGLRFVSQYQGNLRVLAILLLCFLSLVFVILGIVILNVV